MLRDTLGRRTSDNTEPALFMTGIPPARGGTIDEADNNTSQEAPQHSNDLNDDIFGSAPSSPVLSAQHDHNDDSPRENARIASSRDQHHSDIPRLRSIHITNGYREGIAVSKESHIQAGFDEGFSLGGEIGQKAGYILGVLEGIVRGLKNGKENAQRGDGKEEITGLREEVEGIFGEAKDELRVEKLLGQEYFGGDGIWLYEVEGEEGDDVTFEVVAAGHPVLRRWMAKTREVCDRVGLRLEGHEGEEAQP
ncbi:putative protein yae1 [Cercospora beticola]|uniref:Protein YAE1 n=1 Tax=Cercospora beticola TaxID=122368 RepID=A0A2G5HYH0_CERBT|nr:putative protein yae1 [Cercospora beticola]PIA97570.1 putative protein yae1 [Cercospora beticola]WPA97973.1 hypothetical protein RHO25_002584 [Cercospora beticola]